MSPQGSSAGPKGPTRSVDTARRAPIGQAVLSPEGRILQVNEALCTMLGYGESELLSMDMGSVSHSHDLQRVLELIAGADTGELPAFAMEKTYLHKSGRSVHARLHATALTGDSLPEGILVLVEDITDHKEVEKALGRVQEMLQEAQELAQVGAYEIDLQKGSIWWSDQIYRFLGLEPGEVEPGYRFYDWIHPDDRHLVPSSLDEEGRRRMEPFAYEVRMLPPDRRIRWFSVRGRPELDDQGRPCRVFGAVQEVTDRKLAEEKLRASEELFRQLTDGTPDVVWRYRLSPRLQVEYVSPSFEAVTGYRPSDLYRDPELFLNEVVHPDDLEHVCQNVDGGAMVSESMVRWRHRDGTVAFMETRRFPIRDEDGTVIAVAEIGRNVTERVHAEEEARRAHEEADRANRAKTEFLSRMSHELRTPLNSIIGFAELLEMDDLSADQQESIAYIVKGGRHLLRLINDILDMSRIETGHLTLRVQPIHVNEVLADALDMCRPQAIQRGIQLDPCTPEACEHVVLADPQRLTEVFLNLLTNAIKYNQQGGRVELSGELTPDGKLRVAVTDTGQGIAPEKLSRLFTPFDRLGAESTGVEGTGLGLALAKSVVEWMGGAIGATSELGKGSTFWVDVPLAGPHVELDRTADAPLAVWNGRGSGRQSTCRVLYVEEDEASGDLMNRVARQRRDIDLVVCRTGQEALDLLAGGLPDAVLLDVGLPDMDGEQVIHVVRGFSGGGALPIVVLSADATPATIKRLLNAGASDYVTKPVRVPFMLDLLDDILSRRKAASAGASVTTGTGGAGVPARRSRPAERSPYGAHN